MAHSSSGPNKQRFYGQSALLTITIASGCISLFCLVQDSPAWMLAGVLLPAGILVIAAKPFAVLYAIAVLSFFEDETFRFALGSVTIRPVQILTLLALPLAGVLIANDFLRRPSASRAGTATHFFLLLYLGTNWLSLITAPWPMRSFVVTLLLTSLVALYFVVVRLAASPAAFKRLLTCFMAAGVLQSLYGLYQLAAAAVNVHAGTHLPVGVDGVVHSDFLGWDYGRPYGTFVEPDWFGTASMFFALFFTAMWFAGPQKHRTVYMAAAGICAAALFLSFVRAAWLGFVVGFVFMSLPSPSHTRLRIPIYKLAGFSLVAAIAIVVGVSVSPAAREVVAGRFSTSGNAGFSRQNYRFNEMKGSFKTFLDRPILGNGAGNLVMQPVFEPSITTTEAAAARYDPSLVTTILSDTGVVGFVSFLLLAFSFHRRHNRLIAKTASVEYRVISMGLFGGIVGLFASYVFTHGLWMPLTWVCLALSTLCDQIGATPSPTSDARQTALQEAPLPQAAP